MLQCYKAKDCDLSRDIVSTVAGFNNVTTLSPPLSMTDEDFDFMVETLKEYIWLI